MNVFMSMFVVQDDWNAEVEREAQKNWPAYVDYTAMRH